MAKKQYDTRVIIGCGTCDPSYEPPNETTFVSAEVPAGSNGHHILVTLSDANGYASVEAEWEVKVNGVAMVLNAAEGKNTPVFLLAFDATGPIVAGDTVTVSHIVADSGIVEFIDQPVTNNLV